MLLRAQNIVKEYGIQTVLDVKKLEIYDGDRIGLVGRNGAGKSTLLKILAGEMKPDEGVVTRNCEIAMIRQNQESDGEAAGSFISRMGLKESAVKSGGELTRMAIASAFSKHAPLLFADEPTTNLDVAGIEELEKMLAGYRGAVVLISHDRYLLNQICTQIWEIEQGDVRTFPGNYQDYYEERRRERNFRQFEYEQYRKEQNRLQRVISDVKAEASTMRKPPKRMSSSEWMLYKGTAAITQGHVQSRASALTSRLNHLEKKERPEELPKISMKLPLGQKIKAGNAARVSGFSYSYGKKEVLSDISCEIPSGKKTFLTGRNGSGKSTLLQGIADGLEGTFITSEAKTAYYSQNQSCLDLEKTVLENVVSEAAYPEHICRAVLANLYLSKNDLDKKVKVLSGGERVKTALAKTLTSGCNFLILDEPANHMDIYTMEGLEELLSDFDGTLLAVSHDRAFIEKLADRVLYLEDGKLRVEG